MIRPRLVIVATFIVTMLFAASAAHAAICPVAIQNNVTPSFGCELGSTNNDQPVGQVNVDNLFGVDTWAAVSGPTNVNALSGSLTLPVDFWTTYNKGLLVLKGGEDAVPNVYVGYLLLAAGGLEIEWDSPFVNPANQSPANVSHTSLYGTLTPVPLPAALVLLLSALAGLGFLARWRTTAV